MRPNQYKIITKISDVEKVAEYCKVTGYCSIDFETSGKEFHSTVEYPTIIGVSFQPGFSYIIPLGHSESPFKANFEEVLKLLDKLIFRDPKIVKVAWNLKFEHKWLMRYGCNFEGPFFDGMLAKYLLDEERPNDLKSISAKFFPDFMDYEDEVDHLAKKHGWANVPLETLSKYCAIDCDLTLRLMILFEKKLIKAGLYDLFRNLIMPASRVLAESEFHGMLIDSSYLSSLIKEYAQKIEENETSLRNHKRIKKFERSKKEEKIQELIEQVQNEIDELEESDKPNKDRLVKQRQEKLSRYIAGEFVTKKERGIISQFNFSSPKQLIELLFTHEKGLGFKPIKFTTDKFKRPTTTPSTDESVLDELKLKDKSGFIDQLLTHRFYNKLYGTYMVGMQELLSENNRVHSNFNIQGTTTGRLSCNHPNLQQVPRDTTAAFIKKMFIAPLGCSIVQIDYSQAELRVMADIANERSMIEWFTTGKDIHLASACKKWGVPYEEALAIYENESDPEFKKWKMRRKQAKTINFGIIYCQMAKKLAITLSEPGHEVTPEQAQKFLDDFDRDFPAVKRQIQKQKRLVRANGFVKTLFGRKRRLPNIYSSDWGKKAEAERQSVNAPIQGTASDFALFSSVLIRDERIKGNLPGVIAQAYTVHDSLGFYVKDEHIHDTVKIMRPICENPQTQKWFGFRLKKVKMGVDFEAGKTWGGLTKYNENKDYTNGKS